MVAEAIPKRLITRILESEHARDRWNNEIRLVYCSQRNEPSTIRKVFQGGARGLHGESALARSSGADERQQRNVISQQFRLHQTELALPTNERRAGQRQVMSGRPLAEWFGRRR